MAINCSYQHNKTNRQIMFAILVENESIRSHVNTILTRFNCTNKKWGRRRKKHRKLVCKHLKEHEYKTTITFKECDVFANH